VAVGVSLMMGQTERGDQMWARLITGGARVVGDTKAADLLD
jgi:hypothetical protein